MFLGQKIYYQGGNKTYDRKWLRYKTLDSKDRIDNGVIFPNMPNTNRLDTVNVILSL